MIPPPSADELRALARDLGLELSDAELELYRNLMAGSLGAFAAIDAAPSGLPEVPAGRDWWEPSAGEPARRVVRALRDPHARATARSRGCASRRRTT